MPKRLLICDDLPKDVVEAISKIQNVSVDVKKGLKEHELIEIAPEYFAMVVRSSTQITASVIKAAKNLKVIVRAGMGYDNIDLIQATESGVVVMNTPAKNAVAACELAIGFIFCLLRKIPQAVESLKSGVWDRKSFVGLELTSKTLGLLGFGHVGRNVALRALGLGMKVLAHDPFLPKSVFDSVGVTGASANDVISKSDVLSLHMVLNEQTKKMFNLELFKKMKRGSYLVNCSRGEVIHDEDLICALDQGLLAGCALDVFETEPLSPNHPFLKHPKIICTPHIGASTMEAQEQIGEAVVMQLKAFIEEDIALNGVNVPNVSRETLTRLGGHLSLSYQLGSFLAQTQDCAAQKIQVSCWGALGKEDLEHIQLSCLLGYMKHFTSDVINFVNVKDKIKERSISVAVTLEEDQSKRKDVIEVSIQSQSGLNRIRALVLDGQDTRITKYNDYDIEATPSGWLLLIQNDDVPGILGQWATKLGEHGVNISRLHLSNNKNISGQALSMVNIDTKAPSEVLQSLNQLKHVKSVKQIDLN